MNCGKPADCGTAWRISIPILLPGLALLMLLVACDGNENAIRTYEVAKSTQHHGSTLLTPSSTTESNQGNMVSPLSLVQWTMPQAWHQEPSNRQMILAVFHVDQTHTLEVQVSAISGDAGGVLANVNRWRNQLDLPPITDPELGDHVEIINTQGSFGGVVDVTNPQTNKRTIATVIQGGAGMSWFVKASGDAEPVGKQKQAIITFTESFRFNAQAAKDHNHDPADHEGHDHPQSADSQPTQAPGSSSMGMQGQLQPGSTPAGSVQMITPQSWTQTKPSSPVIQASYNIKSSQGDAVVTVTSLNNDGGGLLPNINRWRNQIGLEPVAALSDQPVALLNMAGVTAMLIDLEALPDGNHAGKRMLMAVVSLPTETWYFKMTGSTTAITQLKSDFINAVQSARFAGVSQ